MHAYAWRSRGEFAWNSYIYGENHQSLYTEIKVICVFLQRKRVCSSVCTYMNIHVHECFPTIYPVKMG